MPLKKHSYLFLKHPYLSQDIGFFPGTQVPFPEHPFLDSGVTGDGPGETHRP
jgi:hypothetical protein